MTRPSAHLAVQGHLRSLYEHSMDGLLLGLPDGRLLMANPAACRLFALSEAEIIRRGREGLLDWSHPASHDALSTFLRDGRFRGEAVVLDASGARIPIEMSAVSFAGDDGEPYVSVVLRDLRPSLQAERTQELLAERERTFRAFFDSTAQAVIVQDAEGRFLEVNPAAAEIMGVEAEALLGRTPIETGWRALRADGTPYPIDERPSLRVLRTGRPVERELLGLWNERRGEYRWVHLHAHPLFRPGEDRPYQVCIGFDDLTDLRAASKHALAAAERTRSILETVTDAITIVSADGAVTYANAAAERVLGLEPSAIPGRSYRDPAWQISAPDGGEFPTEDLPFERVRRTLEPVYDVRHAIRHPDGRRVVLSVNAAPLRDGAGKFTGIVAAIRDVTAAQVEQARLAHLAAVLASSPDAMMSTAPDGTVTSWNQAAEATFGYTADEIVGQSSLIMVPAEEQDRLRRTVAGFDVGTARMTFECTRLRKDGSSFPATVSIAPMLGRSGNVIGYAVIARDDTHRLATEDRLRFQARLLDDVQEAVAAVGADGRYIYVNRRARELLGWDPEIIIGRHFSDVVPHGFPQEVVGLIERSLAGESWVGELYARAASGNQVPALLTLAPIYDVQSRIAGVVGLLSDLSRVRSLEEQLGHAQKMEAIGRLAGGVAHDFNNVLTAIQGHAQLALESMPEGRVREDLFEVLRSAERATTLTRHLLAFSRRQVLQPKVVEVAEVIHGMDRMLRRLIGEDIEFTNDCPAALARVLVDPVQLEQVVLNLVMNARDAMPAGGTITVRTRLAPAAERGRAPQVVISVTDTGGGIPRDLQERIFEPFFTTKAPGKGSGLGLSTAYGIVKQSGGFITVSSREGEGSVFSVHLPAVDAPSQPHRVDPLPVHAAGGTETVLLAEDEVAVRRLAHRILTSRGYRVIEAEDGMSALAVAASYSGVIDALVTDIVMPRMNGLELVAQLRARRPDLAVLLMSGYSDDVVEQRGLIPRDSIFLAKPFTPVALAAALRDALAMLPVRDTN